jgi:hypothetical protein
MMMKRRSKKFWLITAPLATAAFHLALLCLALFPLIYYARKHTPPWAEPCLPLLRFLAWPFYWLGGNPNTLWMGIVLSFLWMPAIAFGAVKVCMILNGKNTEQSLGALPHDPAGRSDAQG